MQNVKADGTLEKLGRVFRPFGLFDLQLGLVVPAVQLALLAVGTDRKLRVNAATFFASLLHSSGPAVLGHVLAVSAGAAVVAQTGLTVLTTDTAPAIAFRKYNRSHFFASDFKTYLLYYGQLRSLSLNK